MEGLGHSEKLINGKYFQSQRKLSHFSFENLINTTKLSIHKFINIIYFLMLLPNKSKYFLGK